jgi:hypothetical protein
LRQRLRKRFGTVRQFVDHLNTDVLPPLLDRLSARRQRERRIDRTSGSDGPKHGEAQSQRTMEAAVGLEPTKTGFAGQRLDHFGIATPEKSVPVSIPKTTPP